MNWYHCMYTAVTRCSSPEFWYAGNKCEAPEKITVSTNEAQRFADMNNMPVFETSAMDDGKSDHVDSIFMTVAHKLKVRI